MEEFLQNLIGKIGFLNVGDERLQAEFASHIGWGFAVPLLVFYLFWLDAFKVCLMMWAVYSVWKETITDGHLKRMIDGTESHDERKDFWTDLFGIWDRWIVVEKMNAFVCDKCRTCCAKSVDGFTVDNGWVFVYEKDGTRHYCPTCVDSKPTSTQEPGGVK